MSNSISRRQIAKGAAWAVPAASLAVAAPASAATTPACPTCIKPGGGAFAADVVVVGGRGLMTVSSTFRMDASACGVNLFKPAYTAVELGGTVTFSDGTTYSGVGGGSGAGTLGQISAFTSALEVGNIAMPNGGTLANPNYTPKRPTKICLNFNFIFARVALPPLSIECPQTLCWNISATGRGIVTLGEGDVAYSGTITPA